VGLVGVLTAGAWPGVAAGAARDDVRIATGAPTSLDPARQGDVQSAAVTAQVFESLTAVDPSLVVRPALAASWTSEDAGRRFVFTLRPGLAFSDGSPLTASDVVRSWLRVLDPRQPSPLASLLDEVEGAVDYRTGRASDPSSVGISAVDDRTVAVRLTHPVGDLPLILAAPPFGIVPPEIDQTADPTSWPASGGYELASIGPSEIQLKANPRYWAGTPAIQTVHLVTDLGGQSPVDAFSAGDIDYAPISSYDAAWIQYDRQLGPSLRSVPSMSLTYYGFDTTKPPFDDPRVREAFAKAVDWRHMVELAGDSALPATGMVPPGTPGRSDQDFLPTYDPAAARQLLADAGYPGGAGFPTVTMVTPGSGHEGAILDELKQNLGVTVAYETMDFGEYFDRLEQDPPAFWALSWVADYPGVNDFLGLLLGTGRTANYGRWSSTEFDAAIADALEAPDAATARAAYDRAEALVRDQAPVVPVEYGTAWALAAPGLAGTGQNGMDILRIAGMAWTS
jgi:oligopeptide transport system substrate-binding protein